MMLLNVLISVAIVTIQMTECTHGSDCKRNDSCKTWLYPADGGCRCGSPLGTLTVCNNETQEVSVLYSFCLTSFNIQSSNCSYDAVVGRCLYALHHGEITPGTDKIYRKADPNITRQDKQLCGYLNRRGRLCGMCKDKHFVSPYSYDMKCYKCRGGLLSNVVLYLTVAYLPLTVFLVLVIAFRISVTTPHLNAIVFMCQLLALPANLRYIIQISGSKGILPFINILATIYGIWNLDFFRTFIPPICLPLNSLQTMSLDYLVAFYPLLLLACFYTILRAYDRRYRVAVMIWRPFLWCTARMRQQWNVRYSIIDAFATFLLLSYIKFLNTSFDILIPTSVYNVHGQWVGYFLYYDATIEFMGPIHTPYAILAIIALAGILFIILLLLLYPTLWFQRCLNKCRLNSSALLMFMQCFQGYYRDRTDGGKECRYFAAMYPSLRIVSYFTYAATRSSFFFPIMTVVTLGIMATILVVRPYKKQYEIYNKLDILIFMAFIAYAAAYEAPQLAIDRSQVKVVFSNIVCGLIALVPLLFFSIQLVRQVKHSLHHKWALCVKSTYYNVNNIHVVDYKSTRDSKPLQESA